MEINRDAFLEELPWPFLTGAVRKVLITSKWTKIGYADRVVVIAAYRD